MIIDINNIEELICKNKQIHKLFPKLKALFDQWIVGFKFQQLKFLAKKSNLELLKKLNCPENIKILNDYFKEEISINSIEHNSIININTKIDDLYNILNNENAVGKNICISRDGNQIYLSLWR